MQKHTNMKLDNAFLLVTFLGLTIFQSCNTEEETPTKSFSTLAKGNQIVSANNHFAFSLFNEIYQTETEKNFMISPVSASLALGMVYNGASGETQQAFSNLFNYGNATLEETNLINQNIINNVSHSSSGTNFEIANSIWVRDNFPVKTAFLETNKTYYNAEVQNKDFKDPKTLEDINNWVSNKTHEKIPKILNEISPSAVLYAINALYFKSDWKFQFKSENTKPLPFKLENGSTKQVDMMSMEQDLKYFSNDIFSSIQLPYKNDKYTMTLLLPNIGNKVEDIISIMTNENWTQWQNNYYNKGVKISIPKFKFSYSKFLNDILINLGLGIAFTNNADFSGISDIQTKISFVLQKTFIDVNEKGTEAAAATIVGIELTSSDGTNQFIADRPFVFAITEKETGSICFMGKVGMPEYSE